MGRLSRLLSVAVLVAAAAWGAAAAAGGYVPTPLVVREVFGRLGPVLVPEDNPMTAAKVALGQRLFEDPLLSGDGSLSCESCHLPDSGYTVPAPLSPAFTSKFERRNAPTLINVGFTLPLIWDGRAGALDEQPLGSLGNVLHLNNDAGLAVEQLDHAAEACVLCLERGRSEKDRTGKDGADGHGSGGTARWYEQHQLASLTGTVPVGFRYVSHQRSSFIIRCTLFQ